MIEEQMKSLTRKRGGVKHKLTNFKNYFETLKNKFNIDESLDCVELIELETRVDKLDLLESEFNKIQENLEDIYEEDELENQRAEETAFCNEVHSIKAKAKSILQTCSNSSLANTSSQSISNSNNNYNQNAIKLPAINCPTFNGEFSKWLEFKDTFEALFHNNNTLTDIQKYHYLRSCLGNEASKIIQSLEFAAHNYNDAWGILCDRFDNSRLLVNNHLQSLFDIAQLNKESPSGIRELIDSVNKHLRALNTLQLPTNHWDVIIIHMVSLKLDKTTNKEWEQSRKDKSLPTLKQFFEFLKNKADILDTLQMNVKDIRISESKNKVRHSFITKVSNSTQVLCTYCKQRHLIYVCEKFLQLTINDRWKKVREMKLCANCLSFGHFSSMCKKGNCKKCSKRHNTLLHYNAPQNTNSNGSTSSSANEQAENQDDQVVEFNGSSVMCENNIANSNNYVLLSTAFIYVQDNNGKFHKAHALLDSGSQCSLISERLAKQLKIKTTPTNISVFGINNSCSQLQEKCQISIKSVINKYQSNLNCIVVPNISGNIPTQKIVIDN